MRGLRARLTLPLMGALALACIAGGVIAQDPVFSWRIPAPFPRPSVPADNAMNNAKVELGRRLFYDTRLSVNRKQSCASCHKQEFAFTDGQAQSVGTTGQMHPRGSMSLANVAYNPRLTWANPLARSLEDQALVPMLGTVPIELGMGGRENDLLRTIQRDTLYQRLFPQAFVGSNVEASAPYSMSNLVRAIAAFERTLLSMESPYDRYRYGGDTAAISASAKRGEIFFFSGQRGGCFQCHGGWNFSGNIRLEGRTDVQAAYFNTGLYNIAGPTSYPATNTGVHETTNLSADIGKFRVPTLRNIAVTGPYMHDGSVETLGEVLEHYAEGGRTIRSGPNAGQGRDNPNKSRMVRPFQMKAQDKEDLINFLMTLTDSSFLTNPAFSDPWRKRK